MWIRIAKTPFLERKPHFGELVQLDGSFHDWLERRGPRGCLMDMVDDMLQPLAALLPIASPQAFDLAVTQLQHGCRIHQLQFLFSHSSHHFYSLQLTRAHSRPLQLDTPLAGGLSLRGHFYSVREGTLSNSFNSEKRRNVEREVEREKESRHTFRARANGNRSSRSKRAGAKISGVQTK